MIFFTIHGTNFQLKHVEIAQLKSMANGTCKGRNSFTQPTALHICQSVCFLKMVPKMPHLFIIVTPFK